MTAAELESKAGAELVPSFNEENVSFYYLKSPPITLPGFTEYLAFVHKDLGTIKIHMNQEINSDIYCTKRNTIY